MAKFHRFVDPSYPNAPPVGPPPSTSPHNGADYDRLNVTSGGTGSGGSAFADGPAGAGPNASTYMVGFGDEATSANANRGVRALAENTDYLDDLLNRPIAVHAQTAVITSAGDTTVSLPANTFVGEGGESASDLFILSTPAGGAVVDVATMAPIVATSISGANIGDGFSAGGITVQLSAAILSGTSYVVHYGTNGSLAAMSAGEPARLFAHGVKASAALVAEENAFSQSNHFYATTEFHRTAGGSLALLADGGARFEGAPYYGGPVLEVQGLTPIGGTGVASTGGDSSDNAPGDGGIFVGGQTSSVSYSGGVGVTGRGGYAAHLGGRGGYMTGGGGGSGGVGLFAMGGGGYAGNGGDGIFAQGGSGATLAGIGVSCAGGTGTVAGGAGITAQGGGPSGEGGIFTGYDAGAVSGSFGGDGAIGQGGNGEVEGGMGGVFYGGDAPQAGAGVKGVGGGCDATPGHPAAEAGAGGYFVGGNPLNGSGDPGVGVYAYGGTWSDFGGDGGRFYGGDGTTDGVSWGGGVGGRFKGGDDAEADVVCERYGLKLNTDTLNYDDPPQPNTVYKESIVKAWVNIRISNGATTSIQSGFNINSDSIQAISTSEFKLTLTFNASIPNCTVFPIVMSADPAATRVEVLAEGASGTLLWFHTSASFTGTDLWLRVLVMGTGQ